MTSINVIYRNLMLAVLLILMAATPLLAQDEATTTGETAVVQKGVYWWADDYTGISVFKGYGVETVAVRLGKAGWDPETSLISWKDGPVDLSSLPMELKYDPVVEIDYSDWKDLHPEGIRNFILGEISPLMLQNSINYSTIEFRVITPMNILPSRIAADILDPGIATSLIAGSGLNVATGIDAALIPYISNDKLLTFSSGDDSLVLYFMNYGYSGPSPRIVDRAWVDSTVSTIEEYAINYSIVLPVYNQAVLYPAGNMDAPRLLPSIDVEKLSMYSDIRQMGTAGTEYTILNPEGLGIPGIQAADRIRVLESTREIDPAELINDLPALAKNCTEVSLFRFPLVPTFDPSPSDVMKAVGWTSGPMIATEETVTENEKEELDKKYNNTQQIIFMIALAMMTVILMRMFSKGAAGAKGGGGGESK
jgi:hypothetical protein